MQNKHYKTMFIKVCRVFKRWCAVALLYSSLSVTQLQEVQGKKQVLEDTVAHLEKTLEENRALLPEKDALIETQSKREKELVDAVQRYYTYSLALLRRPHSQKHCFWFGFFLKATFYIQSVQSLLSELKIKVMCTLIKTCKHGDEIRPIINLESSQQRWYTIRSCRDFSLPYFVLLTEWWSTVKHLFVAYKRRWRSV